MPNRIIHEGILQSDKVDALKPIAEVFYRRLMSVVDDFGKFDGRLTIIRSSLYPLRLDRVSETDVEKWLADCAEAGLVSCYLVEDKPFIQILNFRQTLRIKKSKYPDNPNENKNCEQMKAYKSVYNQMKADVFRIEEKGIRKEIEYEEKENILKNNFSQNLEIETKPVNLIDFFFNDFPNSTYFKEVVKTITPVNDSLYAKKEDLDRNESILIKEIKLFKDSGKANLSYPSMQKFAEHFKNWYLLKNKKTEIVNQTSTSVSFGKR